VQALRGVSGEIAAGSFTFVVGPSGSGKSTLLYLLGALEEPTAGEVRVDGRVLGALSRQERDEYRRTQVGFVFQNFNLLSNLNAVDNVLVPFLPGGINGTLRARAVEILQRVGLGERLTHRPNQLSGGEQQRVAIARALMNRPQVLLADEPTGNLDSKTSEEIERLLLDYVADRQTTLILVTHDEELALRAADRVLRIADGALVE
jgi:putative ABC transport system ATP-binding protein